MRFLLTCAYTVLAVLCLDYGIVCASGVRGSASPDGEARTIRCSAKLTGMPEDVQVPVALDGTQRIGQLYVRVESAGCKTERFVPGESLQFPYHYKCTISPADADTVRLVFHACYEDGTVSPDEIVRIDNRADLVPSGLARVARVTGRTPYGETLPNPNRTDERFDVGGTDLGIIWAMDDRRVGILFGDSYGSDFEHPAGGEPTGSNWRCNLLAFSGDHDLEDGLTITDMMSDAQGRAAEVVHARKDKSGRGDWTAIPTAAIRAAGTDYLHYMMVRRWGGPKDWDTNYSALCRSTDGGRTWQPTSVRYDSLSHFAQVAYACREGYVYMIGTQSGRSGSAYLARCREADMEVPGAYHYWNGARGWVAGDEQAATPVFNDTTGEISLMYHKKYDRWIVLYFCKRRYAIVMRDAASVAGPWSRAKVVASGREYPQLYGSYLHPWKDDEDRVYFLMSMWKPYNVFLMRLDIGIRDGK
ncbi:MAG: DUF4185 domain-containing protein [Rikenellaceae bacterium]|nr:DUF4185 domain-containing protein [Rikenellaceae bacterium]